MANTVSQALGEMVPGSAGSINPPNLAPPKGGASGIRPVPSGPQSATPRGTMPGAAAQPGARPPKPGVGKIPGMPTPRPPAPPRYSANNPPLGTAAGAMPHPGLRPPYPDARSPQATLSPTGVPVVPPPRPPVGSMPPVMPPTMPQNPALQAPSPPTMPPLAQTQAPSIMGSLQMPHIPPGIAPMPPRPGQAPQGPRRATTRPGMSGMLGLG